MIVVLIQVGPLFAQDESRIINASYFSGDITVDGAMDEAVWDTAEPTGNFWQFFPSDTVRAAYPTEMRMLYNDHTLYVGVRADAPGGDYVVSTLRRDFSGTSNDNVTLMFDTYSDGSNAYLFGVTPYGVQRDVLISGGGSERSGFNNTWDETWHAESRRHPTHYVVEFAIPFNALAYPEGSTRWRFQGYRWDFQANERSVWSRVPQNQLQVNLAFLGEVVFERPLGASSTPIALIPYVNAGSESDFVLDETGADLAVGGDAKLGVGQGLTRRPDHPPRPCRPACHGTPKRVLALVARTRDEDVPDPRGARHRLRPVQPARQGISHRQNRRSDRVRQFRFPHYRPPLLRRKPEGEPARGRSPSADRDRKRRDAGPDRACVAFRTEAVDCADSGDNEARSP